LAAALSSRNNLVLAEGTRDRLLSFTTNLVSPRLLPARTLYVLLDETERATVRARLGNFGFNAQLLDYDSLTTASTRSFRGKSIVLSSPGLALDHADAVGRIDGAIVRVLTSRSKSRVIVTSETNSEFRSQQFAEISELSKRISNALISLPPPDIWLNELLLELLYERHAYLAEIQRLTTNSVWWHAGNRDISSIREALRNLSRIGLIAEERGRYYTSTRLGRLVVEGGLPISQSNLAELREQSEAGLEARVHEDDLEHQRLAYFEELILNLIEANGWTTVNGAAHEAARANVTKGPSRGIARRLLEKMVRDRTLTRSAYNRGNHGHTFVYHVRGSANAADIFENKCGNCAFYTSVARRCRLWWSLSRFNAREVYSRKDELSVVAKDKLANANIAIGPKATACDFFAPKKRDFPLTKARELCQCCGKDIETPVAKLVRCANCGTTYKPLSTKILVSYNYEQIFRDRYFEISGVHPPNRALLLPEQEYYGNTDSRDLIVFYPHETIRLGTDGIYVEREEGGSTVQPYEKIYQVVDYGALRPDAITELERRGTRVVRKTLQPGGGDSLVGLYPSDRFVDNLRLLGQDSRFRKRFLESLMLSVIIATKRVADRGGRQLHVLVNRQLLEYRRMVTEEEMTISRALAYEARVNNLYWSAYKAMLRISGLEFKSRVRDRFVRELVQSARARARGYSQANAGINYLHQRRLVQCRAANAEAGIGWIGCEGILHVAKRKPSIGLLLDLSDSFRLADREAFLVQSLSFKVSREDFVARLGRHRLWFFFPTVEGLGKLENIGASADKTLVSYAGHELELTAAYRECVNSFVDAIQNRNIDLFRPFVYGDNDDLTWLEANSK
jgi:hypothetical protein